MNKETNARLSQIFNCFHDGFFEPGVKRDKIDFLVKINIQYLAKLIQPEYSSFYLRLIKLRKIDLVIDNDGVQKRINNIENIVKLKPEIFRCSYNDTQIIISSNIVNPTSRKNYYAELFISCENFKLYDQKLHEIDYRNIIEISEYYWKNK
jgi:hypothetical protein